MGILAKFLRIAWARWADYNSFVAILDLLDWKTGLFGIIGGVAMMFVGATNTAWSPQGVILAALFASACVSVIVIAFRIFAIRRPIIIGDYAHFCGEVADHASSTEEQQTESSPQRIGLPLQIEFGNDERYERTEHFDETGIFRRMIYISVFNEKLDDIQDCNIRLIAAMPRPTTGDQPTNFPVPFGANFDLRGGQRKFIKIVHFAENPGGNPSTLERDNIIISAASGGLFPGWTTLPIPSGDNPAILTLEAFAHGIESSTAHLHIWVDQRRLHAKII